MKITHKLFLSILSLALISCGGGDSGVSDSGDTGGNTGSEENTSGGSSGYNEPLTIDARPTDWQRVGSTTDYVPGMSLSLTIAVPVLSQYTTPSIAEDKDGDLLATFVNGTCRGVSGPIVNGTSTLFMPTVVSLTTDDADASKPVTIKYYSARLHHIFTAKSSYTLNNKDEIYGSIGNPLTLEWQK